MSFKSQKTVSRMILLSLFKSFVNSTFMKENITCFKMKIIFISLLLTILNTLMSKNFVSNQNKNNYFIKIISKNPLHTIHFLAKHEITNIPLLFFVGLIR